MARSLADVYRDYEQLLALAPLRAVSPLVRGDGYENSPVMLVGEAPGEEETKKGIPFCGPSGKLLDQLMAEAGLPRGLCYVTNVLSYRPPGNRTPYRFEIAASRERLLEEIEIVRPFLVITLGAVARTAMRPEGPLVSACHGQLEDSRPVPTIGSNNPGPIFLEPSWDYKMLPTYHPSAGLRNPTILEAMRADLSFLREFTGGEHGRYPDPGDAAD